MIHSIVCTVLCCTVTFCVRHKERSDRTVQLLLLFRRQTYLQIFMALFRRFRVCFVLFVRPADFLHRFIVLSRVIIQILQDNWRPSYDFMNFASSHRSIDEERRRLRIGRGVMEDGSGRPTSYRTGSTQMISLRISIFLL